METARGPSETRKTSWETPARRMEMAPGPSKTRQVSFRADKKVSTLTPRVEGGGVPDAAPSSKCTLAQAEGKGTSQDFGDDDASEPQTTTAHVGGPRGPSDAQREDSPPRRLSSPTRFPCRALRARRRHRPPRPFRWPASRWPSRRGGDGGSSSAHTRGAPAGETPENAATPP